jgi:triacylglycerol esterase/lipase EstA (alpha/beta hydrolase family)
MLFLKISKQRRWLWIVCLAIVLVGLWQLFTNIYREEEKELRRQFRETVKEKFPEQAAELSKTFGLFFFEGDREAPLRVDLERKSIVLVHGLDDPGAVWQSLAPALVKEDFNVWLMQYPNDQPIVESAWLFFEELEGLKKRGIDRISIVAHSMGGLVSREMLTAGARGGSAHYGGNTQPRIAAGPITGVYRNPRSTGPVEKGRSKLAGGNS